MLLSGLEWKLFYIPWMCSMGAMVICSAGAEASFLTILTTWAGVSAGLQFLLLSPGVAANRLVAPTAAGGRGKRLVEAGKVGLLCATRGVATVAVDVMGMFASLSFSFCSVSALLELTSDPVACWTTLSTCLVVINFCCNKLVGWWKVAFLVIVFDCSLTWK